MLGKTSAFMIILEFYLPFCHSDDGIILLQRLSGASAFLWFSREDCSVRSLSLYGGQVWKWIQF
jgi:hypothetical protein